MKHQNIVEKLKEKKLTIAFAESITGGLLSGELIQNCGASNVIKYSVVTYANETKIKHLKIASDQIKKYGVVSKEIAEKMAFAVAKIAESKIGVGITGDAGPTFVGNNKQQAAWLSICYLKQVESYYFEYEKLTRRDLLKKLVKDVFEKLEDFVEKI